MGFDLQFFDSKVWCVLVAVEILGAKLLLDLLSSAHVGSFRMNPLTDLLLVLYYGLELVHYF